MMPVMDGPTTIKVLTKINPNVKIIAASGKYQDEHCARIDTAEVDHFLPKPYTTETLLKVLQQVLHPETVASSAQA
jgi:CheY-like chemotaxis protein